MSIAAGCAAIFVTQIILEQLRALKCDHGQGCYFAKPMPSELISKLLAGEQATEVQTEKRALQKSGARKVGKLQVGTA